MNATMKFASRFMHMKVEGQNNFFTKDIKKDLVINCPVAHFEGNYFAPPETIKELEKKGQVVFRYCDKNGVVDPKNKESNFNGSVKAIAGVQNIEGNVVGFMPHPERVAEAITGSFAGNSGVQLFERMAV